MDNHEKVIKEIAGGGVDYSFECVGITSVLSEAFLSTRTVRVYRIMHFLIQFNIILVVKIQTTLIYYVFNDYK